MAEVRSAGNRAATDRNYDLGEGDRLIGGQQGLLHVLGDGSGDEQAVGMTRRSDKLNAEPGQVKDNGVEDVDFGFARITTPCGYLSELERSAEKPGARPCGIPACR